MKDYIERYEFQNLSKIREIVSLYIIWIIIQLFQPLFFYFLEFFFNKKYVSRENVS